MAGTIFGLPLSIQVDSNGLPMGGALLYLYDAGTTTPVSVYEDIGLTTTITNPVVADSGGRIPEFWLADGSYRIRLTDANGTEVFDKSSVPAIGASSGTTVVSSDVSDAQIFTTGDFLWQPVSGSRTSWVRANGKTIGSSSSGASERANADCESLFSFLWTNFSNSLCAVSSGRGASAAADWAANKTIATLDMRGRAPYGLDDMGNSAASVIASATSAAVAVGQESKAIAQANLPNVSFTTSLTAADHTHGAGTFAAASHTHDGGTYSVGTSITNGTGVTRNLTTSSDQKGTGGNITTISSFASSTISLASGSLSGNSGSTAPSVSGTSAASGSLAVSGTVSSGGSGTALATLSPGRAGSWFIKL